MTAQEFIQIRRSRLNLSQKKLARLMGTAAEYISRMENGKIPIAHKFAKRLYALAGIESCPSCGRSWES